MLKSKLGSVALKFAKLGVSGGLFYWLFAKGYLDISSFKVILEPKFFLSCLLLTAASLCVAHLRWVQLLKARGFSNTFFGTLPLTFIGLFFNFFIPGGVGGDLVKGYYITQDNPQRKMDAASTVLMDRILGFYTMLGLGLLSLLLSLEKITTNKALASMGGLLIAIFSAATVLLLLGFSSRIRSFFEHHELLLKLPGGSVLDKVYSAMQSFRNSPGVLVQSLLLSVVAQLCSIIFMYVVGQAMGDPVPFVAYLFAVPLGFILMAVPIAPAGIGVGQVALLFLFKAYTGTESQVGPTAMTIFQGVMMLYGLLGAFFYLTRKKPKSVEEVVS